MGRYILKSTHQAALRRESECKREVRELKEKLAVKEAELEQANLATSAWRQAAEWAEADLMNPYSTGQEWQLVFLCDLARQVEGGS